MPPAPDRPSSWRTFLRAHWGEIAGADFFTTEVWTPRSLITYYTLFVLDLRSRRVHVAGSTPTPDAWFMAQTARRLTDAVDGFLLGHSVLICDRESKWNDAFRRIVQSAGVRIVLTPIRAPNANAYAERFVRSIRDPGSMVLPLCPKEAGCGGRLARSAGSWRRGTPWSGDETGAPGFRSHLTA